jgi:hypothetical protein
MCAAPVFSLDDLEIVKSRDSRMLVMKKGSAFKAEFLDQRLIAQLILKA